MKLYNEVADLLSHLKGLSIPLTEREILELQKQATIVKGLTSFLNTEKQMLHTCEQWFAYFRHIYSETNKATSSAGHVFTASGIDAHLKSNKQHLSPFVKQILEERLHKPKDGNSKMEIMHSLLKSGETENSSLKNI